MSNLKKCFYHITMSWEKIQAFLKDLHWSHSGPFTVENWRQRQVAKQLHPFTPPWLCEGRECTPVHPVRIESAHLFIRLTWKCVGLATGQNVGTKSYSLLSSTLPVWSSLRFGNARFSSESIQRSLWTVWERASEVVSREQGLRLHKAGLAQKPYQVLTEPQFALPLKWGPPLMADVCLYPKKGWEGIEGTL